MTLLLDHADVRRLFPVGEAIEAMEGAFRALAEGRAVLPLRSILWTPERHGAIGMMPGYVPGRLGAKMVTVFPGNHGTDLDAHQGVVLLFAADNGRLLAILDATEITALRTAAVSALATRLLARENAGDLAIFGSGTQARSHLAAMLAARRIRRVRVWSRNSGNARAFADREARRHGIAIETAGSAEEAARGADLLCTVTSSREPFLRGEWLSAGAHVNAVGSSVASARELDAAAVARGRFFGDRRESIVNESGDFLLAVREGAVTGGHLAGELGDVLVGRTPGRRSDEEITIFKSLGLAIEDVAAADHIHRRALREGAGIPVDLGGTRDRA
jgi:ornithine cyclodeaminase